MIPQSACTTGQRGGRLGGRSRRVAAGAPALALAVVALLATADAGRAAEKTKLTIATQTTWAPSGQIFDVLCNTNVLELNGFEAKCRGFTYGPPLGEALFAGLIDNAFGADAPALRMAARKPGTKIMHRTNDWAFGIIARSDFKGGLLDLRGKTLSGPFATGTFVRCMLKLIDAGIKDPFKEIKMFNQDVSEQPASLQSKAVDAVTTWHPTFQRLLESGVGKVLWESSRGDGLAIQGLSGDFLAKNGEDAAVRYMKAWIMATWWASNNLEKAHEWFAKTSRIPVDLVKKAAEGDRYLRAPHKDIKTMTFEILPEEVTSMQRVMDFLHARGLLQDKMDVASLVDNRYILRAQKEVARGNHPTLSDIRVVEPLYIK